jgi:hypothetical protein
MINLLIESGGCCLTIPMLGSWRPEKNFNMGDFHEKFIKILKQNQTSITNTTQIQLHEGIPHSILFAGWRIEL